MEEDQTSGLERVFDLDNIMKEIERTKSLTERLFSAKIKTIQGLIGAETKLSGIYTHQCFLKQRMDAVYEDNPVLNNTIGNQPYRSLSALFLIRQSLYGSARPIIRQSFESLIIAEYAEVDSAVADRWHVQDESTRVRDQVSISGDVFSALEKKGKRIDALRQTWRDLCTMSHATRQSQQALRVPDPNDESQYIKFLEASNYVANVEYSLDLLFLTLAMHSHITIGHLGRKAYRWWFGYSQDPFGSHERERSLKQNIKALMNDYFLASRKIPFASKMLRKNIFQYRRSWT